MKVVPRFLFADVFLQLLPAYRMVWLAGPFGSGKTVLATILAQYLVEVGHVKRIVSNIPVSGSVPAVRRVPDGAAYYSKYLGRWYHGGDMLPLEDACILMDEAAAFMDDWSSAKDYVAALRKSNLYLLMPSVWSPANRLRAFEVRRTLNLYSFGLPAWRYSWFLVNGRTVAEKGAFVAVMPHRYFGISDTSAFPSDDGGIFDAISHTFKLDQLRANRAATEARRQIISLGSGQGASTVANDLEETIATQAAWSSQKR